MAPTSRKRSRASKRPSLATRHTFRSASQNADSRIMHTNTADMTTSPRRDQARRKTLSSTFSSSLRASSSVLAASAQGQRPPHPLRLRAALLARQRGAHRPRDRHRHTETQTHRHTDIQTYRGRQTHGHRDTETQRHRDTDEDATWDGDAETDTPEETETETVAETQTQSQTHIEDAKTQKQADTQTQDTQTQDTQTHRHKTHRHTDRDTACAC
eukprot:3583874-Rhodomonas_salina.1